jgi:hypothetical protein
MSYEFGDAYYPIQIQILYGQPVGRTEALWRACLADSDFPTHYTAPEYFCEPLLHGRKPFAVLSIVGEDVTAVMTGLHDGKRVQSGLSTAYSSSVAIIKVIYQSWPQLILEGILDFTLVGLCGRARGTPQLFDGVSHAAPCLARFVRGVPNLSDAGRCRPGLRYTRITANLAPPLVAGDFCRLVLPRPGSRRLGVSDSPVPGRRRDQFHQPAARTLSRAHLISVTAKSVVVTAFSCGEAILSVSINRFGFTLTVFGFLAAAVTGLIGWWIGIGHIGHPAAKPPLFSSARHPFRRARTLPLLPSEAGALDEEIAVMGDSDAG